MIYLTSLTSYFLVQNKQYWVPTDDRYECTAHSQSSINQHNVTSPRHCSFCTLKGLSPISCTQLPCPVPHIKVLKNIVISLNFDLLNCLGRIKTIIWEMINSKYISNHDQYFGPHDNKQEPA